MASPEVRKRQQNVYPTQSEQTLLKGLSAITGTSKSRILLNLFREHCKTLKPEILEAARFKGKHTV